MRKTARRKCPIAGAVLATGALLGGCGRSGNGASSGPTTTAAPAHWRYGGEAGPRPGASWTRHAFDGKSGPVELHFVHRSTSGGLAVLGFLVQPGATHSAWKPFVDVLPTREGDHAAIQLDWPKLVPASATTIRYAGSLTVPPCREEVQWLVAKDPLAMSNVQIKAFTDAYSGNSRPRQALQNRAVTIDSRPAE